MSTNNSQFYSNLKVHDLSVSELVASKSLFTDVPEDWHVLISDIRDSSSAIRKGKHNEVNWVATGSVVAILNLAYRHDIHIPFFFGGDGCSLLIPEELLQKSLAVLQKHRMQTLENFGLDLRIGHVPVRELYERNLDLKIARTQITELLNIPLILGKGLHFAEKEVKNREHEIQPELNSVELDLSGMECKWDKVEPPEVDQQVISLIIDGCHNEDPSQIYSDVLKKIDEIYGPHPVRTPITAGKLKLKAGLSRIKAEIRSKYGKSSLIYIFKHWLISVFGEIYLRNTKAGKNYMKKLVELTDNLSLDGRINTVITGTSSQQKALLAYLDELESASKIKYGYNVSRQSVMSCYVRNIQTDDHIHFVDGANGGYTRAANNLKQKRA